MRSFTAVEVSDGTLLNWVNTDVDKLDLQAGSLDAFITNETATGFDFSVNSEGSNKFKGLLPTASIPAGNYTVTLDVALNSGSLTGCNLFHTDGSGVITPLTTGANSLNLTSDAASDIFFYILGTAVADVSITNITLTQTTADGHVSTWYDQSGNTNHATQGTPASQPKIVDAGVLVTDRDGKVALNGKGAKLDLPNDTPMLSADGTYSLFAVVDFDDQRNGNDQFNDILRFDSKTLGGASSVRKPLVYLPQNTGGLSATSPSWTSGSVNYTVAETLSVQLLTNIANPALLTGNNTLYKDGVLVSSSDLATDVNTETRLQIDSQIFDNQETTVTHFLSEVIYYPSDQSDNRTAFEANIGEVYGIAGIPAYDNTVNGFVETWYDQSGNGNNASQSTASNQPKIVDTGVLVLSNGDAAIKSTASNGLNFSMASLSADGQQSVFGVLENDVTSQDNFSSVVSALSSSTSTNGVNRRPYWFIGPSGNLVFSVDSDSGYSTTNRERRLYSHIMEDTAGGTSTVYQDGTQVDTRSITLDANPNFILAQVGVVGTNAVGALYTSEVIYYPSDESVKRAAIEDNIDNHYGITSAGSYVNAAGDSYINAAGDTYLQP